MKHTLSFENTDHTRVLASLAPPGPSVPSHAASHTSRTSSAARAPHSRRSPHTRHRSPPSNDSVSSSHVIVTAIQRQLSLDTSHVACDCRDPPPRQQPACAPPTARTPAPRRYDGWPRPGLHPDADEALEPYCARYGASRLYPDADEALSARGEPCIARYSASRLLRGAAWVFAPC